MAAGDEDSAEARQHRSAELLREIAEMPERHVYFSLYELHWCIDILAGNERQLLAYLDRCEGFSADDDIWPATEHELTLSAREVTRLMLNYMASARSLVEHADGIHSRLFATRAFLDYEAERKTRIDDCPLVCFVRELRNHLLHEANAAVVFSSHAGTGGTVENQVCLSRARLLGSTKRWKRSAAKTYLANAPESLPLRSLVGDYGRHVGDFYSWYRARAIQIWEPEYLRHREKVKELVLLRLEDHVGAWLRGEESASREVFFLRRLIDETELEEAEAAPYGSPERIEAILTLLGRHLVISEDLADKMHRALASEDFRI